MWDWLSNWSSNPTSILAAIAVIALIWRVGRWTQRIENGLQTLGERIDAQQPVAKVGDSGSTRSVEFRTLESHGDGQETGYLVSG